jgi:hydroxyacylglutathione hydrolase
MASLEIEIVPALSDNYVYLLHDAGSGATAVVDPGEAPPVLAALDRHSWTLTHILATHHHMDHIGGVPELRERFAVTLIGPAAETRIPGIDIAVADGDRCRVGDAEARVFEVPGHTLGHIAFWFAGSEALFSGDTLFALGCGRMFEGNPPGFWHSLDKLRALPDATRVYCGHEYTQSNLKFALSVDPDNAALQAAGKRIVALRAEGKPTIPSLMGEERAANPFLRADDPGMQASLGMSGADPAAVFGELRARKDKF